MSETSEKSKDLRHTLNLRRKIYALNTQIHALNLWILWLTPQYDKGKIVLYEIKQVSFISMTRTKQQTFKTKLKQTPRCSKSKFSQNNKLFK